MTEQEAIKELHDIRPRGGIIPQKRAEAIDVAIKALEEIQEYRSISTPEECRAAVEKQRAKRPSDYQIDDEYDSGYCPCCGKTVYDDGGGYCPYCGQMLEWDEEE